MPSIQKLIPIAVLVQLALNLVGVPPASAAPSCSFTNGVLTIVDDTTRPQDSINVWQDTRDQVWASIGRVFDLVAPGTFCSRHPIAASSVTSVSITGGTAKNRLSIWLSETPAATPPTPPAENGGPLADWGSISWTVNLGSTIGDTILIVDQGATEGLSVTAGDTGIDLDGNGQVDVRYEGVAALEVIVSERAFGGKNIISAAGGAATGGPVTARVTVIVDGGKPMDTLIGGSGDDVLDGSDGTDRIVGGDGNDQLTGDAGNDRIAGDAGNDRIKGGPGRDVCWGGPGLDGVSCEVGHAR